MKTFLFLVLFLLFFLFHFLLHFPILSSNLQHRRWYIKCGTQTVRWRDASCLKVKRIIASKTSMIVMVWEYTRDEKRRRRGEWRRGRRVREKQGERITIFLTLVSPRARDKRYVNVAGLSFILHLVRRLKWQIYTASSRREGEISLSFSLFFSVGPRGSRRRNDKSLVRKELLSLLLGALVQNLKNNSGHGNVLNIKFTRALQQFCPEKDLLPQSSPSLSFSFSLLHCYSFSFF